MNDVGIPSSSFRTVIKFWDNFLCNSRFIETFGTHIIVGMKMGGKDVIYVRQQHDSHLQPADVQKRVKEMADKRFADASGQYGMNSGHVYQNDKVCETFFFAKLHKPTMGS